MSLVLSSSKLARSCAALMVLGVISSVCQAQAAAQQAGDSTVREEVLAASDGWPIHATYYESAAGKESPVVILLAGAEGLDMKDARNRRVWQATAVALQKGGFAVIAVDLRKNGDSIPEGVEANSPLLKMGLSDYPTMVASDMEAINEFLLNEHQQEKLNIRKLGIVAVGSSAMVAAAFAVEDWAKKPYPDAPSLADRTPRGQDVRALIMYSPNSSVKGISSNNVLRALKAIPVAINIVASKDIKDDARNADKIYKAVELRDEQYKDTRKQTMAGGDITAEGFLEGRFAEPTNADILAFLTKYLKELDAPWASRKSRL